jgi:hypothetical protein
VVAGERVGELRRSVNRVEGSGNMEKRGVGRREREQG